MRHFLIARLSESDQNGRAARLGESSASISNQHSAVEAQNKAVFGAHVVPSQP
jgi:hypothetical protein